MARIIAYEYSYEDTEGIGSEITLRLDSGEKTKHCFIYDLDGTELKPKGADWGTSRQLCMATGQDSLSAKIVNKEIGVVLSEKDVSAARVMVFLTKAELLESHDRYIQDHQGCDTSG